MRVPSKTFCCTGAFCCQKFVQYICMLCPGRFILVESVSSRLFNHLFHFMVDSCILNDHRVRGEELGKRFSRYLWARLGVDYPRLPRHLSFPQSPLKRQTLFLMFPFSKNWCYISLLNLKHILQNYFSAWLLSLKVSKCTNTVMNRGTNFF